MQDTRIAKIAVQGLFVTLTTLCGLSTNDALATPTTLNFYGAITSVLGYEGNTPNISVGEQIVGSMTFESGNAGTSTYIPGQFHDLSSSGGAGCGFLANGVCIQPPAGTDAPVLVSYSIAIGSITYATAVLTNSEDYSQVNKQTGVHHGNYFESFSATRLQSFYTADDSANGLSNLRTIYYREISLSRAEHSPGMLFSSIDNLFEFSANPVFGLNFRFENLSRECPGTFADVPLCRFPISTIHSLDSVALAAVVSFVDSTQVSEPISLTLLGVGVIGLGVAQRKKSKGKF